MRFSLKIVFAFITSVVLSLNSFAQKPTNNHDKLALQYFEQKEFEMLSYDGISKNYA